MANIIKHLIDIAAEQQEGFFKLLGGQASFSASVVRENMQGIVETAKTNGPTCDNMCIQKI